MTEKDGRRAIFIKMWVITRVPARLIADNQQELIFSNIEFNSSMNFVPSEKQRKMVPSQTHVMVIPVDLLSVTFGMALNYLV